MVFEHHSVLKLTIGSCSKLNLIESKSVTNKLGEEEIERVSAKLESDCEKCLDRVEALQNLNHQNGNLPADEKRSPQEFEPEATQLKEALDKYLNTLKHWKQFQQNKAPNPFVVVSLNGSGINSEPIVFTKVLRDVKKPNWDQTFKEIPIGLFIYGTWAKKLMNGNKEGYAPNRLKFSVYHDFGFDKLSEEEWERKTPHTDLLLASGEIEMSTVLCAEKETNHMISMYDSQGKPLEDDGKLKVSVEMQKLTECAEVEIVEEQQLEPKLKNCKKSSSCKKVHKVYSSDVRTVKGECRRKSCSRGKSCRASRSREVHFAET